jgi:hypothetical protein
MFRIFILILLSPVCVFALSAELKKDYAVFQKKYSEVLDKSSDKNYLLKYFGDEYTKLKKDFDLFSKNEKAEISPEGNQMALDIEMLEPLHFLASSRIDVESCSEADILNEMNSESDDDTFKIIKKSLQTLCK